MQTSTMDYVIYIFHYIEVIGDVEFFLPFGVAVHEELGSGKYNFFSVRKGSRKKVLLLMARPLREELFFVASLRNKKLRKFESFQLRYFI